MPLLQKLCPHCASGDHVINQYRSCCFLVPWAFHLERSRKCFVPAFATKDIMKAQVLCQHWGHHHCYFMFYFETVSTGVFVFFFKLVFILFEKQLQFIGSLPLPVTARAGSGKRRGPGTPSGSLTWVLGTQALEPLLGLSGCTLAGSRAGSCYLAPWWAMSNMDVSNSTSDAVWAVPYTARILSRLLENKTLTPSPHELWIFQWMFRTFVLLLS